MTKAERIEAAAMNLRAAVARSTGFSLGSAIADMDAALALPPDPQPRRLTVGDMIDLRIENGLISNQKEADFLNARIFGGSNDE